MNSYDRSGQYEPNEEVNLADDPDFQRWSEDRHNEAVAAMEAEAKIREHIEALVTALGY